MSKLLSNDFPKITPHIDEWCVKCHRFEPNGRDTQLIHCLGCHRNLDSAMFPTLKFPDSFRDGEKRPLIQVSRRCYECYEEFYKGVNYKVFAGIKFQKLNEQA